MAKNSENKMSKTTLAMICTGVAVLIMIIVILAIHYLNPNRNFFSNEFRYSLKYNEDVIAYQNILLDGTNRLTMDRFGIKGQEEKYYLSVSGIDAETDLDEALAAFESDGSYTFTREDSATYGAGNYHNMGGGSMTHSYFAQKDEDLKLNNKKEPEVELVIYKGELVVTEK